jgi:hypothetical protein
MTAQLNLFPGNIEARVGRHVHDPDASDKRKLMRSLRNAGRGGLVNGMSKAALRRYAPEKLPRVTVDD